MSPSILHRSDDDALVLLDIPASIKEAQASKRSLLSVPAIERPYETPEPKGRKRDKLLKSIPAAEYEKSVQVQALITRQLHDIGECLGTSAWCLDRCYIRTDPVPALTHNLPPQRLTSGAVHPPLVLSSSPNHIGDITPISDVVVINPFDSTTEIVVSGSDTYYVPPFAVFLCSTIERGLPLFTQAIRCLRVRTEEQNTNSTPRFDLILLDPPWTNRSVRHSRVYIPEENQPLDPFEQTIPLIDSYLSTDGYLAVWITNKAKIRTQVITAFEKIGLQLVGEWIWLKCTIHGAPTMPLDGIWRKPYEFLLLFSRVKRNHEVGRRIIVAVPDMHSRKPNLKSLFETFLPKEYHALEIFARSLTAGWWSWGDEVLKFQHESNWI